MRGRIVAGVVAVLVLGGLLWWLLLPFDQASSEPSPGRATVPAAPSGEARPGPTPGPSPAPSPAPSQKADAAAVGGDADAPAPPDDDVACDDLDALGPAALDGALTPEQIACLEATLQAGSDREADLLTLLSVQAWTTDRDAWARYSLQLASIDPSPDLHHKLALHYRKTDGAAALHHIAVAREYADRWPEERRADSLARLDKLEAGVCAAEPELADCPKG